MLPAAAAAAAAAIRRNSDETNNNDSRRIRRRLNNDNDSASPSTASATSFNDLPTEVIARVVSFGVAFRDRTHINNLRLVNKKIKAVVDDPTSVAKPWPILCPFRSIYPKLIVFSQDGSRVAVGRGRLPRPIRGRPETMYVAVWDRCKGLLGEFEYQLPAFKPAFSPNGKFLILPAQEGGERQVRVCQLPPPPDHHHEGALVAVSTHDLSVLSLAFSNRNSFLFLERGINGIQEIQITRDNNNGQVTLTEPELVITVESEERLLERLGIPLGSYPAMVGMVSYSGIQKGFIAYIPHPISSTISFYNIRGGTPISRTIPNDETFGIGIVADMSFSHDGNCLAIVYRTGAVAVFDCDVDRIEDIGPTIDVQDRPFGDRQSLVSFFRARSTKTDAKYVAENPRKGGCYIPEEWSGLSWKAFVKNVHKENVLALVENS